MVNDMLSFLAWLRSVEWDATIGEKTIRFRANQTTHVSTIANPNAPKERP